MGLYGDFERSLRGKSRIEREKKRLQVKKKAESGDAESQFIVGAMYWRSNTIVASAAFLLLLCSGPRKKA